jgi:hypothetical protein
MANGRQNVLFNLIGYVGGLLISELLAAVVDSPENCLTLCNTINPNLTALFFGPTNVVVPIACGYAGVAGPSPPTVGSLQVSADAATIIHDAATLLLT